MNDWDVRFFRLFLWRCGYIAVAAVPCKLKKIPEEH